MVVDVGLQIHRDLGPGLLESVYESVLARRLQNLGLGVARQRAISIEYDGLWLDEGFRTDLIVEELLVIELKSVEQLAPIHYKQLLTYLRLMRLPVGLLLNFGAATFREGIKRVVNDHQNLSASRLRVNQKPALVEMPVPPTRKKSVT